MKKRIVSVSVIAVGAALMASTVAQTLTGTPEENKLVGRTATFYVNPPPETTPPDNVNNNRVESLGVAIAGSGNVLIGWEDDGDGLTDLESVWTLYNPAGNSITPNTAITTIDPTYAGLTLNSKFLSYFRADKSAISGRTSWGPKIKANLFGSGIGMGATSFELGIEVPEFADIQVDAGGGGDFPSVQLLSDSGDPIRIISGAADADAETQGDIRIADWDYLANGNIAIVGESRQEADMTDRFGGDAPKRHAVYRVVDAAGNEVKGYSLLSSTTDRIEMWHGVGVTKNGFAVRFARANSGEPQRTMIRLFDNNGNPTSTNIDIATVAGQEIAAGGGRGDGTGFHGNGEDAYVLVNAGNDSQGVLSVWVTVINANGTVRYSKSATEGVNLASVGRVDAAIHSSGRVFVVWNAKIVDDIAPNLVMGRMLDATGKPIGPAFYISEREEETTLAMLDSTQPRVAVRGDAFAVIWESRNSGAIDPATGFAFEGDVVAGRLFGLAFEPGSIESVGLTRIVPDTPIIVPEADALGNWEPYSSVLGNSTFLIEGNTYAEGSLTEQRFVVAFQPVAGGPMKLGEGFFSDNGQPYRGQINFSRQNGNPGRVAGDKRPGAVNFMVGAEASPHVLTELFNSDGRWDLGFDRLADGRYGTVQTFSLNTTTLTQTMLSKAQDSANGRLTSGDPQGNSQITRFGGELACLDNGNFVSVVEDKSKIRNPNGDCGTATIFAPDGSVVKESWKVADGSIWSNVAAYRGGFAVRMNGIIFFYDNDGNLKGQLDQAVSGRSFDRGRGDGTRIGGHINSPYLFLVGTTGAGLVSIAAFDSRDQTFVAVADVSEPGFVADADRVGLAVDALSRVVVSWVSQPGKGQPDGYEFQQVVARVMKLDGTAKSITPLTSTFFAFINRAKLGIRTLQMNPAMTTRQILIAAKGEINLQNKPELGPDSPREVNLFTVISHPAPADDPTAPAGGRPTISIAVSGANAVVTFTGVLQAADNVQGPYTDVAGATSPRSIPLSASPKKFWRSRSQ